MTTNLDAQTYKQSIFRQQYEPAHEVLASDVSPIHHRKAKATIACVRHCLDAIIYGSQAPGYWHWAEILDASNLIETFIDEGYIDDPDDLHGAVHQTLVRAGNRYLEKKVEQLRFDGVGATAMVEFVDAMESMLESLSARQVIKAVRQTRHRCAEVLAGRGPEGAVVMAL